MIKLSNCLLIICLSFSHFVLKAEQNVDSLKQRLNDRSIEVLERAITHTEIAKALLKKDVDSCLFHARKALGFSKQVEDNQEQATALYLIGEGLIKKYKYEAAIDSSSNSLRLSRILPDSNLMGRNLYNLGISYFDLGKHDEAMQYLLEAIAVFKGIGKQRNLASSLLEVGTLFNEIGLQDKSLEYQFDAMEVYKQMGNRNGVANAHNNIGMTYLRKGEYDNAIMHLHKSMRIWMELGMDHRISYSYINIGLSHSYQDNEDSAIWYYNQALQVVSDDDLIVLERVYNLRGMSWIELGNYDDAIASLNRSKEIAIRLQSMVSLHQAHESLAEAYKRKGNIDSAFFHFSEFSRLRDTILHEQMAQETIRMEAAYSAKERKKELAIKNQQLQIAKQEKKIEAYRRNLIVVVGISLVLIVLLLYARQRARFKRDKQIHEAQLKIEELNRENLERDVLFKNKQLVSYALQLEQKNDIFREIQTRLDGIKENADKDKGTGVALKINQLKKFIDMISNSEMEWEEFGLFYEQVHPDFFKKLKKEHSYLTNRELRLCALLNINLSTKEIANILRLSPKSVEISRYRLRKKMGLRREDNLVDFIIKSTA